jgi:hypothetical protein
LILSEEALASYRRSLAMRETLAAIPGASAQAQRDVSVSLWKLAQLDPNHHPWRKVYTHLQAMQSAGLLASRDERFLETARLRMVQQEAGTTP